MAEKRKLIDIHEFSTRLSVSRSSIYRLLKEDTSFPRPVKIGPRRVVFVQLEADAYVDSLIAARDGRVSS
jgi:predicted DNA-binding transcriptional regulator AlpA